MNSADAPDPPRSDVPDRPEADASDRPRADPPNRSDDHDPREARRGDDHDPREARRSDDHDPRGYVVGAIWSLRRAGHRVGGFDLALDSAVPAGAGFSSSAAVECVTILAVATLSGLTLTTTEIAGLAHRAENDLVGVPCGPMDQMACAAAESGSVLLFDTCSNELVQIPFNPAADSLAVLVIDTHASHSRAEGEHAARRAEVERSTAELGVRWLREVSPAELSAALALFTDDVLRRRTRHVVTENKRVLQAAQSLQAGRIRDVGPLLTQSHQSLRDDLQVSCDELDVAVEAALSAGALGARMTGGGFGGSAIALVEAERLDTVWAEVAGAFEAGQLTAPTIRVVSPAAGACRES